MPTMPSTTRSGASRGASVTVRPPARVRAASPPLCGLSDSNHALTRHPRRDSIAPAYSASPPLSPLPTSSTTRAPYAVPSRSSTALASPAAARCISAPSGNRAISARSAARTCSTVCALLMPPTLATPPVSPAAPGKPGTCDAHGPLTGAHVGPLASQVTRYPADRVFRPGPHTAYLG